MVSPKRSLTPDEGGKPDPKRLRAHASIDISHDVGASGVANEAKHAGLPQDLPEALVLTRSTLHSQSRQGIQRAIAMVLRHDGFDSATPEAMESFTQLVEKYVESIIRDTKWFAASSRREWPVPVDYERTLKRHNVSVSALKPHLRPPLPKEAVVPSYDEATTTDSDALKALPILGPELSGDDDKKAMSYIPEAFPAFPSKHTYRFTAQEDINVRDSKSIREQAARTAQQGEDALRRLVRASKMRKQKEVKSLVEKDGHGKERFRLWESTMKRFMGLDSAGQHPDDVEIADHSMIVNGDVVFSRKEMSRLGKRAQPLKNVAV